MKKNQSVVIGIVVAIVVVIAAVIALSSGSKKSTSNQTSTTSVDASSAVATDAVTIQNYMYMPATIKVKVGTTVTWTNKDAVQHSVTAKTASPNAPNGPLFSQDKTYSYTFKAAGSYPIYCILHPYMHSAVIVTN